MHEICSPYSSVKGLCRFNYISFAGTKVEGILRQSADVEEVDRRVQEYEQGTDNYLKCPSTLGAFEESSL